MSYSIKLFYNTGFNPSNVPDSPALINSAGSGVFESMPLTYNRGIGNIRVKVDSFNAIKNVDYAAIGDWYYFVTAINMLSPTVAELTLITDYIGTVGISNITVLGGWTTRRHYTAEEDTFGANTLAEPWTPLEPPVMEFESNIFDIGKSYRSIVICAVDLENISTTADEYINPTSNNSVVVPSCPEMTSNWTEFVILNDTNYAGELPNTRAYVGNSQFVQGHLSKIRALGLENLILYSYNIPTVLSTPTYSATAWAIDTLTGLTKLAQSQYNATYATVENKKAIALYNNVTLTNISSGASQDYPITDVTTDGQQISFSCWADLLPTGSTYARPTYYRTDSNNVWFGAVKGAGWQNNQIQYSGTSGYAVTHHRILLQQSQALENFQRNTAYAQANYNRQVFYAPITQVSGVVTGYAGNFGASTNPVAEGSSEMVTTPTFGGSELGSASSRVAVAGATVAGLGAVANVYQTNDQLIADRQQAIEASGAEFAQSVIRNTQQINDDWLNIQIAFPYSANLQIYYGNDFQLTATHLSDTDVQRFDLFLHQFGYATSEKFAATHLNNRTHFNFIKVDNAYIKTGYGTAIDSVIASILANGVRIWHTIPTAGAMQIGGN